MIHDIFLLGIGCMVGVCGMVIFSALWVMGEESRPRQHNQD